MKNFRDIAAALFPTEPGLSTKLEHPYYVSHGFHRLRWSKMELEYDLATRYSERDLSAYLPNDASLGPYERQLLGSVLVSDAKLILVLGYAGSGKTSAVRYALAHFEEHAHRAPAQVTNWYPRQWKLKVRPAYAYIDFNRIWPDVENAQKNGASDRDICQTVEQLLVADFPSQVLGTIERAADGAPAESILLDVVERVLKWESSAGATLPETTGFRINADRWRSQLPGKLRNGKASDDFDALKRKVATMPIFMQLEFWCSTLEAFAVLCNGTAENFFVVFDNVDPMDEHVQRHLHDHFVALKYKHSLRFLVPVRPVNFRVRAFSAPPTWFPHCGPRPIDIVIMRALRFVAEPEHVAAYKMLTYEDDKAEVVCRVFELALRLGRVRPYNSLGHLVESLAGDSVRRAFEIARYLLETDMLTPPSAKAKGAALRIARSRERYEMRVCLDQLATAFHDEAVALSAEITVTSEAANETDSSELIALRVSRTVDAVMSNCIVAARGLSQVGRDEWETCSAVEGCMARIEASTLHARAIAAARGLTQKVLDGMGLEVARQLREKPAPPSKRTPSGPPPGVRDFFLEFVSKSIVRAVGKPVNARPAATRDDGDDEIEGPWDEWDSDGVCRLVLQANNPYVPARAILQSRRHVVNLFECQGKPSDLRLRVIYLIASRDSYRCRLHDVIEDLRLAGAKESDILDSVNALAAAEIRLLWADRNFGYQTFEELLVRVDRPVLLSRPGYDYYWRLLGESLYPSEMWVPSSSRDARATPLVQRAKLCLAGLGDLWAVERERCEERLAKRQDGRGRKLLLGLHEVAALDVLVRIAPDILEIATRRCSPHKRRRTEVNIVQEWRDLINAWHRLIREETEWVGKKAGLVDLFERKMPGAAARSVDPEYNWPDALRAQVSARLTIERLAKALSGSALWAHGLVPDEFHS